MSEEFNDMFDDIIGTVEKVKEVVELHTKIYKLLEEYGFDIRMSIASMIMSRAIIAEADTYDEAYGYVARVSHTLVDVIDAHKEKQNAEDDDDDGSTLQ